MRQEKSLILVGKVDDEEVNKVLCCVVSQDGELCRAQGEHRVAD